MTFTGTKLEAILGEEKVEKVRTSRRPMKADAVQKTTPQGLLPI